MMVTGSDARYLNIYYMQVKNYYNQKHFYFIIEILKFIKITTINSTALFHFKYLKLLL